jgi:flagellar basal body-associated protein FliL
MDDPTENKMNAVSQDDIDRMLSEDEDILDEADEPSASESGIDEAIDVEVGSPEETAEADDEFDESAEEASLDQVILEDIPPEQRSHQRKKKAFIRHLEIVFWICSTSVVVIGGAFDILLVSYNRTSAESPQHKILAFPVTTESETSTIPTLQEHPRFVYLKRFIASAPRERNDVAFVTADFGLELTTATAADTVKDHAPFFRSILYDVLLDALRSMDKTKINEIDLKLAILNGLNAVLPDRSVRDVIVDSLVMHE